VLEDVSRTTGVDQQDLGGREGGQRRWAKKVIELAQTGDCDLLRLKELTIKAFGGSN